MLLSGGASALMAVPADGITLADKQRTTAQLLRAGADIYALNTIRKHLSAIKGGWLAERAAGRVRTYVISDVVGDDRQRDCIGSDGVGLRRRSTTRAALIDASAVPRRLSGAGRRTARSRRSR